MDEIEKAKELYKENTNDIFYTLRGWYTKALECKGLNNEEIHDEFTDLLGAVETLNLQEDDSFSGLLEEYTELLRSRRSLTDLEHRQFANSFLTFLCCVNNFTELQKYCDCCGPKFAMENLIDAYYWLGFLDGADEERKAFGLSTVIKKAVDNRHLRNRERKLEVAEWYRKNKDSYKSKDEAAVSVSHLFSLSHGTARKHLIGL
jgi:hypothetical protein